MGIKYQGWLFQALRRAHNREFVESMTDYRFGRWCITGSGTLCRPISD
nr:MAG TPA: hypothetical protein [Caudoviricetes sp.]